MREVMVGGGDPRGKAGSRTGQWEVLGYNPVITKVSANPRGSAESGIGYRVISH